MEEGTDGWMDGGREGGREAGREAGREGELTTLYLLHYNPRRACAARVIVLGLLCVFALICHLTHWNHKREIPTDSSQYGNDLQKAIFVKHFIQKL